MARVGWLCAALLFVVGCDPDDDDGPGKKDKTTETSVATGDTGVVDPICETATWDIAAEPMLRSWCTPCHSSTLEGADRSGAPEGMDFDTWENARPFAELIKSVAVPDDATMPPEGKVDEEERVWLGLWVDCGAPGEPEEVEPCDELRPAPEGTTDPCAGGYNQLVEDFVAPAGTDLSCICVADGSLTVEASVVDLPLVASIGGDFGLAHPQLVSVSAPELEAITGDLLIEEQAELESLSLPHLRTVGGDVRIIASGRFERLELQQLTDVGGDLRVEALPTAGQVWLPRVEVVGGTYAVADNPELYELPFYFELVTVGGNLVVRDNPKLTEVVLGTQLTTLGGGIDVGGNQLTVLAFAHQVVDVPGDVYIHDEPYLEHVEGLLYTTEVHGLVLLRNLPSLQSLEMLPIMETAGGIWYHQIPTMLEPVKSVATTIDGDVLVTESELQGLPYMNAVTEVHGDVELVDMPMLTALSALSELQIIHGDFILEDTGVIVAGLPTLYRTGSMTVRSSEVLEAVAAPELRECRGSMVFEDLRSYYVFGFEETLQINGDLVIDNLDAVDSLDRLQLVELLTGDLVVRNNELLADTDATDLSAAIDSHLGTVITANNGR